MSEDQPVRSGRVTVADVLRAYSVGSLDETAFHRLAVHVGDAVYHEEAVSRWAEGDMTDLNSSPAAVIQTLAQAVLCLVNEGCHPIPHSMTEVAARYPALKEHPPRSFVGLTIINASESPWGRPCLRNQLGGQDEQSHD